MKADEVDQRRIRRTSERMTGKSHGTDQNKGDDVQTKDEKLDGAKKETEEENQSEEIGSEQCVAPGDIQSNSGIPEYCPDEDDKAAREESEHEDAACTQKRESEEADISETPLKGDEWHLSTTGNSFTK